MIPEETLQGAAPGPFDLFKGGPVGDECAEEERVLVTEPLYRLRIIGF